MKITLKVAAVILNSKKEVLLIRERYEKEQDPKWNLIKGTYDNIEETLVDCIKREIKEEVGLMANSVKLHHVFQYGNVDNLRVLFVFQVTDFEGEIFIQPESEQIKRNENIISANWFTKEELSKISEEDCMAPYVWLSIKNIENNTKESIEILKIDV